MDVTRAVSRAMEQQFVSTAEPGTLKRSKGPTDVAFGAKRFPAQKPTPAHWPNSATLRASKNRYAHAATFGYTTATTGVACKTHLIFSYGTLHCCLGRTIRSFAGLCRTISSCLFIARRSVRNEVANPFLCSDGARK